MKPVRSGLYPPISTYGIIGDGRTAALVSEQGSIDWLCLPDFDGPTIFAALLDRHSGGRLGLRPPVEHEVTRRYLDTTPVLETTFTSQEGSFRVIDFMPLALDGTGGRIEPERELIRIVEGISGEPEVELSFDPRPDYGQAQPILKKRGKLGWTFAHGADFFLLRTDIEAEPSGFGSLRGCARLRPGERRYVSFSFTRRDIGIVPGIGAESDEKLEATCGWWREWISRCRYDGDWPEAVKRSLVTLRLLNFNQSGAVVAAATTSLPESIGGVRNWDYRFCWLRDSAFILRAFIDMGYDEEGQGFLSWLLHATRQTAPRLRPLYTIYGRQGGGERNALGLEGYMGSAPVRVGNGAASQTQLDVYGAVIEAAHDYVERGGRLDGQERKLLLGMGEVVIGEWRKPDAGIWEIRGGPLHNTYSKAQCWAALDRLIRMIDGGYLQGPRQRLEEERDRIRASVMTEGWNEALQRFDGAYGRNFVDASTLLMPRLGIIDADDPKMRKTFDTIQREIGRDELLLRYNEGVDGFASNEGAFVVCSFWAIDHLARRGDIDEAKRRFEAMLARGNDLGLYAEEIDLDSGEMLGNFPQAYSHAGLIGAAMTIKAAERGELVHGQSEAPEEAPT